MEHSPALARAVEFDKNSVDYELGQRIIVAKRGPATIATRVLPGLWGVEFIGLEGFGYVFEEDMCRVGNLRSELIPVNAAA